MRVSSIYARVGNFERANAIHGTPKDIDVHVHMGELARTADAEARASMRSLEQRAYGPGDVNTPRIQGFAVDYQDGVTYIADAVAPIVPTNNDPARKYTKFSRRDAARMVDDRVAPKGKPGLSSIDMSSATYIEQDRALMAEIANKDLKDARDIPKLLMAHGRAVRGDQKRAREYRVANKVMTSANYAASCSTALSSTNRWDVAPATSTARPLTDILITAKSSVAIGATLNAGVCSLKVAEYLRIHPEVTAKAGINASDRRLSFNELRDLLGLQYLFVGDLRYDQTGSAPTASYGFAWGTGFALLNIQPGANDEDQSWMKSFFHQDLEFIEETDRVPGVSGITILKSSYSAAEEVTASDCGFLLDTVIS